MGVAGKVTIASDSHALRASGRATRLDLEKSLFFQGRAGGLFWPSHFRLRIAIVDRHGKVWSSTDSLHETTEGIASNAGL